jgi:hypothetical protein
MADAIISLDEFIGGLTDANSLVVDKSFIESKDLLSFSEELISFLGIQKSEYKSASGMGGSWSRGIKGDELQKVLKLIPEELRNSNTISIVNWDLFLKSAEAAGNKIPDNVKKYLPESYLVKHNQIVDSFAASNVEYAKGSTADLEATKAALNAVWLNEPFNGNVFAGQSMTDMNNVDTPFGAYMANVNQKIRNYVQTQTSTETPVTTTTMPPSTETTAPPSTTMPSSSSQPPSTYTSSTGNTGASGEVIIAGPGGVESATQTAGLSFQEWMFQNPNATYIDLMNTYGTKTVTGATSFGKRYGYSAGTEGEWNIRSFYDFPLQLKSENDISKLQDDLRKAGFFNFEGGQLPIRGVIDSATTGAWSYFLKSAALSGMEPAKYLVKRIQEVGQLQWDQQVIGKDPDTIQSRANDLGSAILGRGLNAMEIKTLQDVVKGWEKQAVTQGNFADEPMDIDLNARMEKYLQNTYRDEAVWTNYAQSRAAAQNFWS